MEYSAVVYQRRFFLLEDIYLRFMEGVSGVTVSRTGVYAFLTLGKMESCVFLSNSLEN